MALKDKLQQDIEQSKNMTLDVQRTRQERELLENRTNTKNIFFRAWISYFLSMFIKDRGTIPTNIGTSIQVLSNMYITRKYLSTVFEVLEFGGNSPMLLIGKITDTLRKRGCGAKLSWTFMPKVYDVNVKDGLDQRVAYWEKMSKPDSGESRAMRERYARQIYTYNLWKQGKTLQRYKVLIHIHGSNLSELNIAQDITYKELANMGTTFESKTFKTLDELKKHSMLASPHPKGGNVVLTNSHLAQMVPNFGGENDKQGVMFGINKLANLPYRIDFSKISIARNMYIVAPSGVGKTVLAANIVQSAVEQGSGLLIMDIKGNEYKVLINSIGGITVSLRLNSRTFINSWILHADDVRGKSPTAIENYFKDRLQFSKRQIVILSGLTQRDEVLELESLLDEFLQDYYLYLGITADNINSWDLSKDLTPFHMWNYFEQYVPSKLSKFKISSSTLATLRMYFTPNGTKSYVFGEDMRYNEIIEAPGVCFDFGLLSSGSSDSADVDADILNLKFLYMQRINRDYTTHNYANDRRTLKVLEESQIVTDTVMHIYAKEYTLGRSQKQDTLLIGNSVAALENSITAKPILESTTCLFVSKLAKTAKDFLIKQFNLQEYEPLISLPGTDPQYEHCFATINNMQAHGMPGLVRVEIPKGPDGRPMAYKVNIPTKEDING